MDSRRELVFDQPVAIVPRTSRGRYFANDRPVPMPTTPEGIVPGRFYSVRKKAVVELGFSSCAECHVRLMPDGSVVKGAQGNLPISASQAWRYTDRGTGPEVVQRYRVRKRSFNFTPWAANQDDFDHITLEEIVRRVVAMTPGVVDREGASMKHPVRIPSLIGIGDLRYLDATGLSRNRNISDLMRYAIVNQGVISVAHYGDYYPNAEPQGGDIRYSDEQLYALSLYLESLKPPPNPNLFDEEAKRGQAIFNRQGCASCHPAPLYTNNKLTPAEGFTVPDALRKSEAILDVCVGADPGVALETRRGTGFYKVPSLRGVRMRSVFGHEGQAASLEEWFDPARRNSDYVPKGFHLTPGSIQGHEYGIKLPAADRKSLIAFLKTL